MEKECAFRENDLRHDARWWLRWLRDELKRSEVLPRLRDDGSRARRNGLPWREYAPHELEALAGDRARAHDYAGHARKRIEALLPPRLKPLAALWILDVRDTLEVELGPSRALTAEQAEDLESLARLRLRGEALTSAERKRLAYRLAAIDPASVRVRATGGSDLTHAALDATAAAAGSWRVVPSAAGYLPVGEARLVDKGRVALAPGFTFMSARDVL